MFSKKILVTSISTVSLALAGCGASDQDSGNSNSNVQLSGLVVDPYVAQAKVYVDLNNNGVHDFLSHEAFAYTDAEGYFSQDSSGNSYCSGATKNLRHCLNTAQLGSNAVIRIEGGYDVASGQPFTGSMSMPVNLDGSVKSPLGAVNPLVSLFSSVTSSQEAAILAFIGASDSAALKKDFLKTDSNSVDTELFRRALQVHKAVAILSSTLEFHYDIKPSNNKKINDKIPPSSAGKFVYDEVAKLLASKTNTSTTPVTVTAPTSAEWSAALSAAETALQTQSGKTIVTAWSTGEKDAVAARVKELFDWFDLTATKTAIASAASQTGTAAQQESLYRHARVADFAVGQVKREVKAANASTAPTAMSSDASTSVMGQVLTEVAGNSGTFTIDKFDPKIDLDSVISATTKPTTVSSFVSGAELFSTATSTETTLANMTLKMKYSDSGSKTGNVLIYFTPDTGKTTAGKMTVCVRATGDTSDLNDIKGLDTGIYLGGRWSKLNDFSATVAITEPVSPGQALIIKRKEKGASGAEDTYQFSLDTSAQLETWKGTLASFTEGTAPTSDAGCQSNLTAAFPVVK